MTISYISNYYKLLLYVSIGGYASVSQALYDFSDDPEDQLKLSYEEIQVNQRSLADIIEANKSFWDTGGSATGHRVCINLRQELQESSQGMSVPNLSKKERETIAHQLVEQREKRMNIRTINGNDDYLANDILASSNNDELKNFVTLILKKAESYGKIIGQKLANELNKGVNQGFGRYNHCIKKGSFRHQKMPEKSYKLSDEHYAIIRKEEVLRSMCLDNKNCKDILKKAIYDQFEIAHRICFTAKYIERKEEKATVCCYIFLGFFIACILMSIFVDSEIAVEEEEVYL